MKTKIIIIAVILSGVIVFLLAAGFYPIALSYDWFVTARLFNEILKSSANYYEKAASLSSTSTPAAGMPDFKTELKRATLDKLIENRIIDKILKQNLGGKYVEKVIRQKLANLQSEDEKEKSLNQAVRTLYDLPYEKFRREVVIPQIKKEILDGQLYLRGIDFEKWLAEVKSSLHPMILMFDLYWKDGKVELKK